MTNYEQDAKNELRAWQREMQRKPSLTGRLAGKLQNKLNSYVPEKVHQVITTAFKHTIQTLLKGAGFISKQPLQNASLENRESKVEERIDFYKHTSAAEGALTGAGGFLWGLADFPLWLTLKMKMLSEIAVLYGFDINDYKERVYLLYIFQLAFSSRAHRRQVYYIVANWPELSRSLPGPDEFDWRKFQQEYRDYIDIAKLIQLIPGIGAIAGAYVNHKYTEKLGRTAMNAYRMRLFLEGKLK
ncbi:EcsC family protein [Polluticoccus soli]|uniref:EcsC family protein n=1 Tax=Polluticoccus soli TaxID=3034150 RepID=UPI0023E348F2|nr:EcsC family protein [Flavipsychrobacter sp. JY13-12]